MAVDRKQFINTADKGIKADKEYKKFYISIKVDGKVIQKVLDFSDKDWDKKTRIAKAKLEVIDLRDKRLNSGLNFNENSTLDQLKEIYFQHHSLKTDWSKELQNMYSKASRDYNEIKRNTDDNGDRVTLENIRANTLKTIENYFKIRLDTLKLLATVANKMSPKDAAVVKGKLTADDRNSEEMDEWLLRLRDKKDNND